MARAEAEISQAGNEGVLAHEIKTFEATLGFLLPEFRNQYVLIKGSTVLGVYHCEPDAISVGYEKLGNTDMLVRKVTEQQEPARFLPRLGTHSSRFQPGRHRKI